MADEHARTHAPTNFNRAFAIGTILNLLFVFIEAGYGALSNSLALIADAGHNFSDVMTWILAWSSDGTGNAVGYRQAHLRLQKENYPCFPWQHPFFSVTIRIIICEAVGLRRKNLCY